LIEHVRRVAFLERGSELEYEIPTRGGCVASGRCVDLTQIGQSGSPERWLAKVGLSGACSLTAFI
jgi:hypothetical protein